MSVEALSWALNQPVGDPTAKLILIGLANHADREGRNAWPSVETLAEYAGCSVRTVHRHLRVLAEDGWTALGNQELVAHISPGRRPLVRDVVMGRGDNMTPRKTRRGDTRVTPGVTVGDTPGVTELCHTNRQGTVKEPSGKSRTSSSPRKADPIWDVLTAEVGPVEGRAESSRRGKMVKELKELGASPQEITVRCARYRSKWPNVTLTDTALVAHWSKFGAPLTEIFGPDGDDPYGGFAPREF